jgi:Flp pilus assembly pilin Flp
VEEIYTISGQIAYDEALRGDPSVAGRAHWQNEGETMGEQWRRFIADQSGATAVEYAVLCGCIFLAVVGAIMNFGAAATNMFNHVSTAVNGTP